MPTPATGLVIDFTAESIKFTSLPLLTKLPGLAESVPLLNTDPIPLRGSLRKLPAAFKIGELAIAPVVGTKNLLVGLLPLSMSLVA